MEISSFAMFRTIIVTCLAAACFGNPMLDGLKKQINVPRIVGGADADIEDHGYMLSLELNGEHICGAVIFKESWALTSGHCFTASQDVSKYQLRAGTSLLHTGGTLHRVAKIIPHPGLGQFPNLDYDFALVEVETPFKHGVSISTIALPEQGQNTSAGSPAVVTGWGRKDPSSETPSEKLQVVNVEVIAQSACQMAYSSNLTDRMICTGAVGGRGPCVGDRGGPMVVGGELIGLVGVSSCGDEDIPSVYSRVSSVRDWINYSTWSAGRTNGISFFVTLSALFYLYITK